MRILTPVYKVKRSFTSKFAKTMGDTLSDTLIHGNLPMSMVDLLGPKSVRSVESEPSTDFWNPRMVPG